MRFAQYAFAAPVVNLALTAFPALSRSSKPWNAINFGGSGSEFVSNGDGVAAWLVRLAGLSSGQTVVEIGMGIGGNATAIYRRFGERVAYRGFDVVRYGVTWCRNHFANLSRRYQFSHADVRNSFYNPTGRTASTDFVFPYDAGSADLIFANSVFTHMQPPEVDHYFRESARVLKPGGVAAFTFYALDDDAEAQIAAGKARYAFKYPAGDCRIESASEPDMAVAYPLAWIEQRLAGAGLQFRSIERSYWRGNDAPTHQDIIIAVRQ